MAGGYAVQVYFRQRVGRLARPNLLLANFTKIWLPKAGSATAEVLIKAEELGYFDAWAQQRRIDPGLYDLFVCADSECDCGDSSQQRVPACLATKPHVSLLIHNE